jgi:hypothetical protein
MQLTLQSFKITNIRQLDENWQETQSENPVTRQEIAQILVNTVLGMPICEFADTWTGDLNYDINVYDSTIYGDRETSSGYAGAVYEVLTDSEGVTSQGRQIADFDIELFTDRNDDRRLLQCEGCGLILTLGELTCTAFAGYDSLLGEGYFQEEIDDFHERITPGEVVPYGEHFEDDRTGTGCDNSNYCGLIHEFDYSKLIKPKLDGIIAKVIELSKADIFYDESFGDQGTINALDDFKSALAELAKEVA